MNKLTPSQQLTKLREEINAILDKGINQFLIPWAGTKDPIYIYIQAWTPSFNDGEPCVHTSNVYDKDEIINDEKFDYNKEFFGNLTEEEITNSKAWPEEKDFRDAIEGVEEALQHKYGTDYQVLITLKDGQVSYVRDHYECGY